MRGYHLDPHPQANVAGEHYAVVKIPRRKRDRCPETNVRIVETKEIAMEESKQDDILYAARVMGPARSSEGCNIYYLLDVYTS